MIRFFDFIVAFIVLVLFAPLFCVIAVLIKLTSEGPVFYLDKRVGLHGTIFLMYKFRTMKVHEKTDQNWFTKQGDPRITAVGKFLRKTSLDELPQVINVLKGDMSLVGPRPESPLSRDSYTEEYWSEVVKIKPGITGLAQVRGRSAIGLEAKVNYDLEYKTKILAANAFGKLWLNLKIMILTIFAVIPSKKVN